MYNIYRAINVLLIYQSLEVLKIKEEIANKLTLQIVSGLRTDDIAAAAILHRFIQLSGRPVAFPFFIDRSAITASSPHLFKSSPGFIRASVGISLEPDFFASIDANLMSTMPIPLYWDNQRDSYRYRGLPGTSITSGESIACAVVAKLKRNLISKEFSSWLSGEELNMFISKYTDILEMLSSSINLNTFIKDTEKGLRINLLPYIYSPSQIFMTLACSPNSINELLYSKAITLFLKDSEKRIARTANSMDTYNISDRYKFGCITNNVLWESDYDNTFASLLNSSGQQDETRYDAIALVAWDPFINGQISQIKIRTLRSEASDIADEIIAIAGRKYTVVEKESKNRINIKIRYLKPLFTSREKIVKKLILPAVNKAYDRQITETKDLGLLGETTGYKPLEFKLFPKAEKIKNKTESITGGLKQCLEIAKQDKSLDF